MIDHKIIRRYYYVLTAKMTRKGRFYPDLIDVKSENEALEKARGDFANEKEGAYGCLAVYENGDIFFTEFPVSKLLISHFTFQVIYNDNEVGSVAVTSYSTREAFINVFKQISCDDVRQITIINKWN